MHWGGVSALLIVDVGKAGRIPLFMLVREGPPKQTVRKEVPRKVKGAHP